MTRERENEREREGGETFLPGSSGIVGTLIRILPHSFSFLSFSLLRERKSVCGGAENSKQRREGNGRREREGSLFCCV